MTLRLTNGGVLCVDVQHIAAVVRDRDHHVDLYVRGHAEPFHLDQTSEAVQDLYGQCTGEAWDAPQEPSCAVNPLHCHCTNGHGPLEPCEQTKEEPS